ncbi:hypothetical protein [Selenomonas flueggei]|nr:hypothetical protein [Selenomonas flueggei]
MEQDPRVRPMSREENAAYRGITVDENGAETQEERRGSAAGGESGSIRYIRIGAGGTQHSLLSRMAWALLLVSLLAAFFFVALPVIIMVLAVILIAGIILRLIGPNKVMSWIVRRLYGR